MAVMSCFQILNQYTQAKAGAEKGLKLALVLHGPERLAGLSHEAYAKPYLKDKGQTKNANLELLQRLRDAGVEISVSCAQMSASGVRNNVARTITIIAKHALGRVVSA